jgi:hypothetical protein
MKENTLAPAVFYNSEALHFVRIVTNTSHKNERLARFLLLLFMFMSIR